jgi:hypothetical protein
MKKRVYISGPMTGYPNANRAAFRKAAVALTEQGYIVLDPSVLPDDLSQKEYMDIDIAMLRCCDYILQLRGWTGSQGAQAEFALAKKLGIKVIEL